LIIACASGKGGTGKTTLATNLAHVLSLSDEVTLLDCDVEEPNCHLFLPVTPGRRREVSIPVPVVDADKCDLCGRCKDICAFNALAVLGGEVLIFEQLCHGCGGCAHLCPAGAVSERPRPIGSVLGGQVSSSLSLVYGQMNPGEALAPPVIRAVKQEAPHDGLVVLDAPPGTSCPVVESVRDVDYCVLVTEPTPFGLHDLRLAVDLLEELEVPFGVVVNRADIGYDKVDVFCRGRDIPILAHLPWDRGLAEAYARGRLAAESSPTWRGRFEALALQVLRAGRMEQ